MAASAKSRNSLKLGNIPSVAHIHKATQLAGQYKITAWSEDGQWWGRCLELSHCLGDGNTAQDAIAATRLAIVAALSADLADGISAPIPARDGIRSEQVNVRVSWDEKAFIEDNARRAGFKGMADYVRIMSLGNGHMAH